MAMKQDEQDSASLEAAEEHGFNAAVHACGRPAIALQDWVATVASVAGGFVGRTFHGGDVPPGFVAFVPSDGAADGWIPALPCEQLLSSLPDAAARERARSWAAVLAGICGGRRPLEASWSEGSLALDLARGRHRAGNAVQEGGTFSAFRGASPERALEQREPSPVGRRIRSLREGGGEGFLVSVSDEGNALVVLGAVQEGAREVVLRISGRAVSAQAGERLAGHACVDPDLARTIGSSASVRAAVRDIRDGFRLLPVRLLRS